MTNERIPLKRLSLEAVAIFLGVTAGLVGDDYREYRNDRDREREALAQMLQDLEIDSLDIDPITNHAAVRAEAMLWLNNAAAASSLTADSLSAVLSHVARTDIYSYEASNFTYAGLRASGRLDLIRNADLRRELVVYFEDRQAAMEVTNIGFLEMDIELWEHLAPYIRYQSAESLVPLPHVRVIDLPGVAGDGTLLNTVVILGSWSELQYDLSIQMLELNTSLASAIRAYLGRLGGSPS